MSTPNNTSPNLDTFAKQLASEPTFGITENEPLAPHLWYASGGPVRVMARPTERTATSAIIQACHQQQVPLYMLGAGANLLVQDEGVQGVVLKLDHPAFQAIEQLSDTQYRIGAGHDLFKLVQWSARQGLAGLDRIAGIPATLGGAVRMNAGGAFGEIGDLVHSIRVIHHDGNLAELTHEQIDFAYRHTNINAPVILDVTLNLTPEDPAAVAERVKEVFAYKKNSQPMGAASCGCAFKNPPPEVAGGKGAGQLIDEAGLKNHTIGGATVSPVHANFLTLDPKHGTANDVIQLIQHVEQTVLDQTGIHLHREIVVWP